MRQIQRREGTKGIIIAGALAQTAHKGGLTWFFLQYVLGFKRLGWNVLFLDHLEPNMCHDEAGSVVPVQRCVNLPYFLRTMSYFGLTDQFFLSNDGGLQTFGLPRERVLEKAGQSTLLINVMGYLKDPEILSRVRRRVFLDIDPGFGQMWRELGLHDPFARHDDFVTLAQKIGKPDCSIPNCGLKWIATTQPVVLEHWPAERPRRNGAFTSIGAWRGPNAPIEYQGQTYGLRVHEFRKFVELPARCTGSRFEMALDIHPADAKDKDQLTRNGWSIVDPRGVAANPTDYRQYIVRSKAEFMVPKHMYVGTNSGLLSDRSAYYLATGRPVLARDTGIRHLYPTGEGLLTFTTLDEARAGVEAINGEYARHSKAARELAVEYFDSDKVLRRLLSDLGED